MICRWIYLPFVMALLALVQPDMVFAQIDSSDASISTEQIIESTSAATDAEVEYDFSTTSLQNFQKHPLNLNRCSYDQLKELGLLSDLKLNAILHYRKLNGDFMTEYELQAVDLLTLNDIRRILPYISLSGDIDDYQISTKELLTKGTQSILYRYGNFFETPIGYLPPDTNSDGSVKNHYLGSQSRMLFKYNYTYANRLNYGITAEKDAGEELFKGSQKQGFDFYSAHLFFRTNTFVKTVALGDYEIRIGQGLMYFSGYGAGKTPLVMMIKKNAPFLKSFTSSSESMFMRGAAATFGKGNFTFTPFISYKRKDANIIAYDTLNSETASISALQESGYHRTTSELVDKNAIHQSTIGAHLDYEKSNLEIGLSGVQTILSAPLSTNYQPYSQFNFSGNKLLQFSADYSYVYRNFNFFGETAMSQNGGLATVNGLLASLDPRLDIALLYRNFQPQYQSIYTNVFAEGSKPANEKGFYMGLQSKLTGKWTLSAYSDIFSFPWLRYRVDAPGTGTDYLLELNYKPARYSEIYIRGRQLTKDLNPSNAELAMVAPVSTLKQQVRFNAILKVSPVIVLKSRAEWNRYRGAGDSTFTQGYLVYQDVVFKKLSFPLSFSTRFAMFSTEDYDTRIYAFENDVQGSFSVPGFYGQGTRFYTTLDYTITKRLEVWLRYARTWYNNQNSIGSGLDLINSNQRNEIKLQMVFKF